MPMFTASCIRPPSGVQLALKTGCSSSVSVSARTRQAVTEIRGAPSSAARRRTAPSTSSMTISVLT